MIGGNLAMLGPGPLSVDARLFDRGHIQVSKQEHFLNQQKGVDFSPTFVD
jgi:hypothetical protein